MNTIFCESIKNRPDLDKTMQVIEVECSRCGEPLWISKETYSAFKSDIKRGKVSLVCESHSQIKSLGR
jgi:hypothetical protein